MRKTHRYADHEPKVMRAFVVRNLDQRLAVLISPPEPTVVVCLLVHQPEFAWIET